MAQTESEEADKSEGPDEFCVILPEDDPVKITFRQLDGLGRAELGAGVPLSVDFELHPSRDVASVEMSLQAETEFEETTLELPSISTSPGERKSVDIDLDALRLGRAPLNFSGNFTLHATVLRSNGEVEATVTAGVSFHPFDHGWMVYDEAAKIAHFNRGLLSTRARALASAPPELPSSQALGRETPVGEIGERYYAFARVTKRSDRTDAAPRREDD